MKVLIVDDNEELACAMSYVVERETKYHARTAPDGCRGYLTYLEFKPDIVIIDIKMPGRNGFELMREIRTHDPAVRTIYMSGDPVSFISQIEEEERQFPVTFLGKPFSFEMLKDLLSATAEPEPLQKAS